MTSSIISTHNKAHGTVHCFHNQSLFVQVKPGTWQPTTWTHCCHGANRQNMFILLTFVSLNVRSSCCNCRNLSLSWADDFQIKLIHMCLFLPILPPVLWTSWTSQLRKATDFMDDSDSYQRSQMEPEHMCSVSLIIQWLGHTRKQLPVLH